MVEMRELQIWQCRDCTHTFYTEVGKKQAWYRRLFRRAERIECYVCKKLTATKKKIVTKEIRDEKKYSH